MIAVLVNPSSSSAPRIAATRPSIMSDGATMSTPARAYVSAVFASTSSVRSLSTSPASSMIPQWPWSVYSQLHTSATTSNFGSASLMARRGALHDPVRVVIDRRVRVFLRGIGDSEQQYGAYAGGIELAAFAHDGVDGVP